MHHITDTSIFYALDLALCFYEAHVFLPYTHVAAIAFCPLAVPTVAVYNHQGTGGSSIIHRWEKVICTFSEISFFWHVPELGFGILSPASNYSNLLKQGSHSLVLLQHCFGLTESMVTGQPAGIWKVGLLTWNLLPAGHPQREDAFALFCEAALVLTGWLGAPVCFSSFISLVPMLTMAEMSF